MLPGRVLSEAARGAVFLRIIFFALCVGVLVLGCVYTSHVLYRIAFCMPIEASMGS